MQTPDHDSTPTIQCWNRSVLIDTGDKVFVNQVSSALCMCNHRETCAFMSRLEQVCVTALSNARSCCQDGSMLSLTRSTVSEFVSLHTRTESETC